MIDPQTIDSSSHAFNMDENEVVEITYYTDPLCCWSWAFEPQWRRLVYEFAGKIRWRFVMGGMLPSWKNFNDQTNHVSRPIQMGPVWMHAAQLSGMPMNTRIWMEDPPASSYPACIAVKCATLQSDEAGDLYLRMLREAIMLHGRNIAKQEILYEIAEELSRTRSAVFDVALFRENLADETGLEAFRSDMNLVQRHNINRFPTLIMRHPGKQPIIMTGYRPFEALHNALLNVAPGILKTQDPTSVEEYTAFWNTITDREIAEVFQPSSSPH